MTLQDIARYRLANQHIAGAIFKRPNEIVAWMGAMQAQDYAMSKWAVGVRLPGATDKLVDKAIDDGAIIRTHIMRPTWHLVSPQDVRWIMQLTAPRLGAALNSNNRRLELTGAVFNKSNRVIEKLLRDGRHHTRQDIMAALQKNKIATNDLRSLHIMFRAEIEMIVCNGARKGKQFTYALFDERVPKTEAKDREAAIAALMKRYFISHGPATMQDFVWWSGLTVTDAKKGLELNKTEFNSITADDKTYWFAGELTSEGKRTKTIHFLPAFDEFMVSYKDRSASLHPLHFSNAISGNGIFRPVIVADGKVIGTWKKEIKKDGAVITPYFFEAVKIPAKAALVKALVAYSHFLGQKTDIVM